jgi:hypothetical protein
LQDPERLLLRSRPTRNDGGRNTCAQSRRSCGFKQTSTRYDRSHDVSPVSDYLPDLMDYSGSMNCKTPMRGSEPRFHNFPRSRHFWKMRRTLLSA